MNPENKQFNNLFNKCICYDFFHNSIRNKIRFILREITNNPDNTPIENNIKKEIQNEENRNNIKVFSEQEIKEKHKIQKSGSFPKDKCIDHDLIQCKTNRLITSNPKQKETSNNSEKKGSANNYYLETHEDKLNKNSEFSKKFEIKKLRSKLKENLKSARKERIINLYTEANINSKSKDNITNISMKRCSSQKNKKINKENLNNYFISEKMLKTKLNFDFDKILVKEFDGNNANNVNNKSNDFFHNKKEIKSTENSKGFSNYTSNGDTGNYFNRKSSVNTNSIGRLNTNDTNKYLSSNSNGMSDLNKFNSNQGNPTQIILNTENNYYSPDENNNENFNLNKSGNANKLNLNFVKNNNNNFNNSSNRKNFNLINNEIIKNKFGSNNDDNNNNISSNPNISIFNNFIFSMNKKTYAKSSSSNLFSKTKNVYAKENTNIYNNANINNDLLDSNQNDIQSSMNIKDYNTNNNFNSNFNLISPKEKVSTINYFSNTITKTELSSNNNNNTVINLQNFNSDGSSKRFDTQANFDSNAFEYEKKLNTNTKNDNEPIKLLDLETKEKNINKILNYDYPKQYFSIGYIFIVLACKNIKLKVFEYLDNFSLSNLEEVKNYNLKKCCLFHCLTSLEEGLKINKKFSIENFIDNFSENLKNFICNLTTISLSNRNKTKKRCLKGNHIYSLNAKSLKEHPWIRNENNFSNNILTSKISNIKITLKEVIKIVRESFKTSLVDFNEKKYENVLNKLEIILINHKNNLKEENIRNVLATKQNIIKKVASDIGIHYNNLYDKVCNLVDKIFKNKE